MTIVTGDTVGDSMAAQTVDSMSGGRQTMVWLQGLSIDYA